MALNILNQNAMSSNLSLFMTSTLKAKSNTTTNNAYYAKKGEPMYQEDMDSDRDGIVSFDEFKEYCKNNNISEKDITDMIELRSAYRMAQDAMQKTSEKEKFTGNLELIYAKDGDKNYDEKVDTNRDSVVSYNEYLRYCEENARMEAKNSDTKIVEDNKNKFMTLSFGHISNAYNRVATEAPAGKVESKA